MCKYNEEIDCDEENCERCGWNPTVDKRRTVERPTIQHIRCPHCDCITDTIIYGIGRFRKPCAHMLAGKDETPIPDSLWEMMMNRMHLYYLPLDDGKEYSGLLEEEC